MNNLNATRNAAIGLLIAAAVCVPTLALAEHVKCVFPKQTLLVLPETLELEMQEGNPRVMVRDSFQASYGSKRAFAELVRESKGRELYKWALDDVANSVLVKLDRVGYARRFLYSLWIDEQRTSGRLSVIIPISGTSTDSLKARAVGTCKRVAD